MFFFYNWKPYLKYFDFDGENMMVEFEVKRKKKGVVCTNLILTRKYINN